MKKDPRSEVRLTADVDAESQSAAREREDEPFTIVVLGDFRGAQEGAPARQSGPLGKRKLERIDRDNFDAVLAGFAVRWEGKTSDLPGQPGSGVDIRMPIRVLEDFHPDRIVQQLAPLRLLLETRRALQDPARFDSMAAEVAKWAGSEPVTDKPAGTVPRSAPPTGVAPPDLLDLILGESGERSAATPKDEWSQDLQKFLQDAVRPHLVKVDWARQAALTEAVDLELSRQVRSVLQDPSFKRLEASWRSLAWLAGIAESGPDLKILVFQASKDDLLQDMYEHESLEEAELARLLLQPASVPGGLHPALLVGDYEFSGDLEDLALLERIGGIARRLKAPFVSAASPALFGYRSFEEIASDRDIEGRMAQREYRTWQSLRRAPPARWLGLALPRVLCRLPYGTKTDPAELFDFEEALAPIGDEALLWGNPAFRVAGVITVAFASSGWSLDLTRGVARLEGLPLYEYKEEGETKTKPCAEVLMTERTVEAMEQAGLIPLVSYRNADLVALPCLQSLAEPRVPLSWER